MRACRRPSSIHGIRHGQFIVAPSWPCGVQSSCPIFRGDRRSSGNEVQRLRQLWDVVGFRNGLVPSGNRGRQHQSLVIRPPLLPLRTRQELRAKDAEFLFVPRRRISTAGWVLPVQIQTIESDIAEEGNGRIDEDLAGRGGFDHLENGLTAPPS